MYESFQQERLKMVSQQIEARGLHEERILQVMRSVPRHVFIPQNLLSQAYHDCPLPIGYGQTISQPYIVALMTQLLALEGGEKVLEIGCGSGYQAAVLSHLAHEVHTIECIPQLAERAKATLGSLGLGNVHVHTGDGSSGMVEFAPYDGVIISAAAPRLPTPILDQIALGGRLVIPIGKRFSQVLQIWKREKEGFTHREHIAVAFVPLKGDYGWPDKEW